MPLSKASWNEFGKSGFELLFVNISRAMFWRVTAYTSFMRALSRLISRSVAWITVSPNGSGTGTTQ